VNKCEVDLCICFFENFHEEITVVCRTFEWSGSRIYLEFCDVGDTQTDVFACFVDKAGFSSRDLAAFGRCESFGGLRKIIASCL
jgi:hypothetical protein